MTIKSISHKKLQQHDRVFCNRALNMSKIRAIGFDMDYTLAIYNPSTFEQLAYTQTIKKLVQMGYPTELLNWHFDPSYMIRGLAIDKARGHIIKMDRHRYVKVAYHGFKELSRDERMQLYDAANKSAYEEPKFALIDTLFTLTDSYLFAQCVDLKDNTKALSDKSHLDIFNDIRFAMDLCHRDGSIKNIVAQNPSEFIIRDPALIQTLQLLKKSGRKVFLATNSLWDYTHVVMNHLMGNDSRKLTEDWISLFDVVITGTCKPTFFISDNALFEVDKKSGWLRNTEEPLHSKTVYQGGNVKHLHKLLGIASGSQVLYVGDHIYGDIVRSKKLLGWRTALIIPELEHEIDVLMKSKQELEEIERLRLQDENEDIHAQSQTLLKKYHQKFHPIWGGLMKTGNQNSRFAAQVEDYACLYTSKVSNLRFYGLDKSFREMRDYMPHDLLK